MIIESIILGATLVILYATRLHSKKEKPFLHEHIWEPWQEIRKLNYRDPTSRKKWDERIQYQRVCLDCGDIENKHYSVWTNQWIHDW